MALAVVAGLVVLIAIFYAEEDWRGKHDWEKFRREWQAKGERFDFKDFIPKPIPDDQNFALTPIVATSYEYMLDKHGHEIKPHLTNIVDRLWMQVYHNGPGNNVVSGIWPTNGDWRIGTMTDLKSWQIYYRTSVTNMDLIAGENSGGAYSYWQPVTNAGSILTNDFAFPPTPQSPAADVLFALSKYDSDIEELRAASRLTNSRFPLNYGAKSYQVYMMHLAPLKGCCQVLQLRAIAELENGESQKALDDVKLSLRLADSIHTEPSAYSQYIRSEMVKMVVQVIWEGLAKHKWSDVQLSAIQQELGKLDFLADCQWSLRCLRSEYFEMSDHWKNLHSFSDFRMFTHNFADPGLHSVETEESKAAFEREVTALAWYYYLMPSGWFYQNQLIIARTYQEQFLPVIDSSKHLFSPPKLAAAGKYIELLPHRRWNFMARRVLNGAAFAQMRKFVYAQEAVDLARLACGLERFRLAHGEYPESLNKLAPQFIESIPHDIIGGQPLKYRRTDDGKFLLYSVGWNETDDGGVFVYREHSTYFVDDTKSDWVWKY